MDAFNGPFIDPSTDPIIILFIERDANREYYTFTIARQEKEFQLLKITN